MKWSRLKREGRETIQFENVPGWKAIPTIKELGWTGNSHLNHLKAAAELEKEVNAAAQPHPIAGFRWKSDFTPFEGAQVTRIFCFLAFKPALLGERACLGENVAAEHGDLSGERDRAAYGRPRQPFPLPSRLPGPLAPRALRSTDVLGGKATTPQVGAIRPSVQPGARQGAHVASCCPAWHSSPPLGTASVRLTREAAPPGGCHSLRPLYHPATSVPPPSTRRRAVERASTAEEQDEREGVHDSASKENASNRAADWNAIWVALREGAGFDGAQRRFWRSTCTRRGLQHGSGGSGRDPSHAGGV